MRTRQHGGKHLGTARFGQIREVLDQVSQKLTEFSKHSHYFLKELFLAISGYIDIVQKHQIYNRPQCGLTPLNK